MVSTGINDAARQAVAVDSVPAATAGRGTAVARSGKTAPASSGKSGAGVVAKVVANPEVESGFATNEPDEDFEADGEASGKLSGWRIERNTNGFYRYRWQIKDRSGKPETYVTSTGGTGYRRGSKYLPRTNALQELKSNGKKRSKRR